MKHLLNDMTEAEKNAIREQHAGGMKVMTEKFSKLLNTKSGDVKPLVKESQSGNPDEYKIVQYVKKQWGLPDNTEDVDQNSAAITIYHPKSKNFIRLNFQKDVIQFDKDWAIDPSPIPLNSNFDTFKKWFDSNNNKKMF